MVRNRIANAKRVTTYAVVLAMLAPSAMIPHSANADSHLGEGLIDNIDSDALLSRIKKLELLANRLESKLVESQKTISALETGMGAIAKTMSSVQEMGKDTAALVQQARKLPEDLSDGMEKLISEALDTIKPGDWTKGESTKDVLSDLRKAQKAAEAVKERYEATRRKLERQLLALSLIHI